MEHKRIRGGTFEEKFWKHVNKSGSKILDTPCWEWSQPRSFGGYGIFSVNGKAKSAHRISWRMANGDPGKFHVLHKCDNKICIRPEHLFLGTDWDNVRDRVAKGRTAQGETHYRAKLTNAQIMSMRAMAKGGATQRKLAAKFDVTQSYVSRVIRGVRRKDILNQSGEES
ncbi:MAG: HNH endonuclease [Xanthomonadales bacterium]|nr:HNH endonuclease [Xanthomonadales bacterium]